MKALTVLQPWAGCIVHAGKNVENRAQRWAHRGPVAIHAGSGWSKDGERDPRVAGARNTVVAPGQWLHGAVLGVVHLVDVHRATPGCCRSPWADRRYRGKPAVHLVLEEPRPLTAPVQCRGALGLWELPVDVDELVAQRMPT